MNDAPGGQSEPVPTSTGPSTTTSDAGGTRLADRAALAIAMMLALVFGLQVSTSSRLESLTWDETGYVAAGYANWVFGDYRLNAAHPPLLQKLQALPLLFLPVQAPPLSSLDWEGDPNPFASYGYAFFFRSGNDHERLTRAARAPVLVLGVLLVLLVYGFGRELAGTGAGLLAAALAAFEPNLIAHAKLATEDLGCTTLMLAAVWSGWRWLRSPGPGRALVCGISFGLALLAKYTALLLGPIAVGLALLAWWPGGPRQPVRALLRDLFIMTAASALLIDFAYGPGFGLGRYVTGASGIYTDFDHAYRFYFAGQVSDAPFRFYALASLLIKTPLGILALFGLAALTQLRRRAHWRDVAVLALTPLFVIGASFLDITSPGVRRILPAVPFVLLFAGLAVRPPASRVRHLVAWGLVALVAVEAARTYPHHLSYISPLFGGPERGPYLLEDSNIDWGQDLPALAAWQERNLPDEPVWLLYFGNSDPSAYGVRARPFSFAQAERPPSGVVAVSTHFLVHFRKLEARTGRDVDWLTKYEPIGRAGHSIWLYHFP